jgi:hypothetical protein
MLDTPAVTARSCKILGCKEKLAPNNTTGYCHEHRAGVPTPKRQPAMAPPLLSPLRTRTECSQWRRNG